MQWFSGIYGWSGGGAQQPTGWDKCCRILNMALTWKPVILASTSSLSIVIHTADMGGLTPQSTLTTTFGSIWETIQNVSFFCFLSFSQWPNNHLINFRSLINKFTIINKVAINHQVIDKIKALRIKLLNLSHIFMVAQWLLILFSSLFSLKYIR